VWRDAPHIFEGPIRRELVQRRWQGDHEAFGELARLSVDKFHAVARLILHDPDRAADATQEALVAAWRDIAALRDPDRFDAWLRRLLIRACYREARRDRARRSVEVHVPELDHGVPDASGALANRDELERGFRTLSPEPRNVIVLHHWVGLPLQETADAMGLPLRTVKSKLNRSTLILRAALDQESAAAVRRLA
jgi:RNA polymerase sigma-70 factor (ECF subfamily)